jgi:hypothetical protein
MHPKGLTGSLLGRRLNNRKFENKVSQTTLIRKALKSGALKKQKT